MNDEERLAADYSGTGLTTGPHPMAYHRAALRSEGILSAEELEHCANRQTRQHRRMRHRPPAARHREGLRLSLA